MPRSNQRGDAVIIAANATVTLTKAKEMLGFACKTAGNLSVTTAGGKAILSAFPVTAGAYVVLPFYLDGIGATVVAAGGASGTLAAN